MSNRDASHEAEYLHQVGGLTRLWRNMDIGRKLSIGFAVLVAITLMVVGITYLSSSSATSKIERTEDIRVPTALDSTDARANLLRMFASTQAYLALGDAQYRIDYNAARESFEADLTKLQERSEDLNVENQKRLAQLQTTFEAWSFLPEELFDLRDDQLKREPALDILITEASGYFSLVLSDIGTLLENQTKLDIASGEITGDDIDILKDMANFQVSFAQMVSSLRAYVTTRREDFRSSEYRSALQNNNATWERLNSKRDRLPATQQVLLDRIAANRVSFLSLIPEMFAILDDPEGKWRTDLYRFRTEAIPLTEEMITLLDEMTNDQQDALKADLSEGRSGLAAARLITLGVGLLALILGGVLSFIFRANIAGPIVRLTSVAAQIQRGDFKANATVESNDEIGTLARTFNSMTTKLRDTLNQVWIEKQRADHLLDVVIPIGVDLTTVKDFNRLLEKMLVEAKTFCYADAGILYLREEQTLRPVIVRNDLLNVALGGTTNKNTTIESLSLDAEGDMAQKYVAVQAALSGTAMNVNMVADSFITASEIFKDFGNYQAQSYLSIPLKNSTGNVLGVLELINAQSPDNENIIPFDPSLQRMMESFSSLAVAALEAYLREQSLKQEIQRLRIEIDQTKRQQEVKRIVESDTFKDLQLKAEAFRRRARERGQSTQNRKES